MENINEELEQTLNVISFSEMVERRMKSDRIESYIKTIAILIQELDIDESEVSKLLSVSLRDKLELEAIESGNLKAKSIPMLTF